MVLALVDASLTSPCSWSAVVSVQSRKLAEKWASRTLLKTLCAPWYGDDSCRNVFSELKTGNGTTRPGQTVIAAVEIEV